MTWSWKSSETLSPRPLSVEVNYFKCGMTLGVGQCPDIINIFKRLLWLMYGK